jgi:hypothetical protein
VSYKDIKAPEGTCLHQHVKLKTLNVMESDNRLILFVAEKLATCMESQRDVNLLTLRSADNVSVRSSTDEAEG